MEINSMLPIHNKVATLTTPSSYFGFSLMYVYQNTKVVNETLMMTDNTLRNRFTLEPMSLPLIKKIMIETNRICNIALIALIHFTTSIESPLILVWLPFRNGHS